jgi:hypothetical protein
VNSLLESKSLMNSIALLTSALESSKKMLAWVVSDFSDADLLVRPVPEANHMAWQLGHLITAERHIIQEQLPSTRFPDLPAGFEAAHSKEAASSDNAAGFYKVAEYLEQLEATRAVTIAELQKLTESDLDRPTLGNLANFCPTLGNTFGLLCDHIMMHLGQGTVVRRKLGKPVLF